MAFDKIQLEKLQSPLLAKNVKQREAYGTGKLSYIAGFHAINTANDIFGFGQWSTEILLLREVNRDSYIKPPFKSGEKEKPMITIAYMCNLRMTVKDPDGKESVHEDVGFGDGVAGDTPSGKHSAIELASKESVTDAMKRCMRYFGNQFGNSLYDKDGDAPITEDDYVASKVITKEQLSALEELLLERDLDQKWAVAWLAAEGWHEPLDALRTDWYNSLYRAVDIYGADERMLESYEADITNVMGLMKKSNSMKMLKALFKEVWRKTGEQNDKPRQIEAKSLYEEIKVKLETEKK